MNWPFCFYISQTYFLCQNLPIWMVRKNNPFFLIFLLSRLVCEHHKDEKEKKVKGTDILTLAAETNSRSLIGTLAASCYIKGNQCPLRSRNGMCENHFSLCLWVTAYLH